LNRKFFIFSFILPLILIIQLSAVNLYSKSVPKIDYKKYEKGASVQMVYQNGHSNDVYSVSFSPDGKYIASCSYDRTIKLWTVDGKPVKTFEGHSGEVTGIAFSPDGKYIASGSWDHTLKLWSVDGKPVKTFESSGEVISIAFSPDGKYIASGSLDSTVKLWSVDGKPAKTFQGMGTSVVFSPDGKYIASGSYHRTLKLWSVDGKSVKTFEGSGEVNGIAFSPDGKYIASVSNPAFVDNKIKLWTVNGELVKTFQDHSDAVNSIVFSPDGTYIASASTGWGDNTIKLWNVDGKPVKTIKSSGCRGSNAAFSPDGKYIIFPEKEFIRILNVETGNHVLLTSPRDGEWFIFDNKGHFECSAKGKDSIVFIKGLTVYEPDQFWNKFFTPGLMARFMKGEKLPDLDINKISENTPDVTIYSDAESKTGKARVTIRVSAKGDGDIGKIFLYHNGRVFDEDARGFGAKQTGKSREFTVDLVDGENHFVGAAFDKSGSVEGRSENLVINYKPEQVTRPDIYIFAVGVSEYKDSNIQLKSPNADARGISEILKKTASGLYGNVNVFLLTDSKASKADIAKAINEIADKCKKSDTVILFFAGHGDTEKDRYYYLPYDADITELEKTGVSIGDLNDFVKKIPANRVALFLDTCKSGSAVKSLGQIAFARGYDERKMIANLAKSKGIAVFSASNENQSAYEIKALGHGIFTWCFIDAIKNRRDEVSIDGAITMSKLLGVVNRATRETADKYLKIEQSPVLYIFGDDIILGK